MSTIMPKSFNMSLTEVFRVIKPTMYYSLYSTNEDFRKEWLHSSLSVDDALRNLKDYQDMTKKITKIHFAFIKGKNDSMEDMKELINVLDKYKILAEFNLVRYNPFPSIQGEESSDETIVRNLQYLSDNLKGKIQMIPRVGFDVKASCGMFVDKKNI